MAVTLTGAGGLFTRLGKLFGFASDIKTHQLDIVTEVDDVFDQYASDRDHVVTLQNQIDSFINAAGNPLATIQACAQKTVIEMVDDDDALPSKDLKSALVRLFDQMVSGSNDVDATTVSASASADGDNTGNGQCIVEMDDYQNHALMCARAEDIVVKCTSDAQVSGTAGRETFSVQGEVAVNKFSPYWPQGSGIGDSITVTDPSVDGGSGPGKNLLTNSDFEDWTSNEPDSWTVDTGTGGETLQETETEHRGTYALELIGTTGAELTEISQSITIKPEKKYLMSFWVRDDGTGPSQGVLRVSVQDGDGTLLNNGGATLTEAAKSVDLTGVGSTYAHQYLAFEAPLDIPASAVVHVELTTALENGRSVYVDGLSVAEMKQFGSGGPYIQLLPGATDFILKDEIVITVTNNNEGDFVRWMDRFFDLYGKGLWVPSQTDTSETITDGLIC